MMPDIYGLNSNDWVLAWEETRQAQVISPRTHIAIDSWIIDRYFSHQILLCGTSVLSASSHWRIGCTLQILASYQNFPLTNAIVTSEVIPPNGNRLVVIPRHTGNYKIRVKVPPWHRDLSLIIYEFTGNYETYTEHLISSSA